MAFDALDRQILELVLEAVSALGRTTTSIVLTSPVQRKALLP